MAFIDRDEGGDRFVNINNRVGTTGNTDDVLVVQALLELLYTQAGFYKKNNPVKGKITVSGTPARDTITLIKHFQMMILKRKNPQGYVNRSWGKNPAFSTICRLNGEAQGFLRANGAGSDVVKYLIMRCPTLTGSLQKEPPNPNLGNDFPIRPMHF